MDSREITLGDGRAVRLRPMTPADAEASVTLDRVLAEDGRGMVLTPEQTRTGDEERARLQAVHVRNTMGSSTRAVAAEIVGDEARGLVGSAHFEQLGPAYCAHVAVLAVGIHPDVQGLGLGRAIMQYLVDHGRACGLERLELYVRSDNVRARALYESLGFVHEATRARFVKLPDGTYVDDHVMVLWIA